MDQFEGFHTFYDSTGCETAFVVPVSDMTTEEFCAEANRTVKEVWQLEDDYREAGYPFTEEHVGKVYVVFDPDLEWEDVKGMYTIGKPSSDSIECYRIHLD